VWIKQRLALSGPTGGACELYGWAEELHHVAGSLHVQAVPGCDDCELAELLQSAETELRLRWVLVSGPRFVEVTFRLAGDE
jgi:hypothetical protein